MRGFACAGRLARGRGASRDLFRDEAGLTTTGVVISLLVTLALVFSSAQVYRVNSLSAEVQDVADAAALAAENQVAKFMLIARTCDAVVLTMSITGIVVTGLGAAAMCVPAGADISSKLLKAGSDILKARSDFADKAASGLNKTMRLLPLVSAAQAMNVAGSNNNSQGSDYWAIALLVDSTGKGISFDVDESADALNEEVSKGSDGVKSLAEQAEQAAEKANAIKEEAFRRDCGDNPGYCMYERAATLAGLPGSSNPLYSSVDAWSFSVALNRAKAYYQKRRQIESPADGSVAEQARSALRSRFYAYACARMSEAYVHESSDSFEAYFPHLPRNTQQMRETSLYTEAVYPISVNEDGDQVMHAWSGCPGVDSIVAAGSIAELEAGLFAECPYCEFEASSMGSVASASTSIQNGFEYHYEAVATAAEEYQKAREELDPLTKQVKETTGGWFSDMVDALKSSASKRIDPEPPGAYGAIAFVVNVGSTASDDSFASGFVNASGTLGTRVAVAAATLIDEGSDEGQSAISSLLDGFAEDGGAVAGAGSIVLSCWSSLLTAYANGQNALTEAIESGLNSLPLIGKSGLGTWAASKLRSLIEDVGLQPAEVGALKPVLVNSGHIASKDDSAFASSYLSIKKTVVAHPMMSTSLFSSVLTDAEKQAIAGVEGLGDSIEIASVQLLGSSEPTISIALPLPEGVRNTATSAIESVFERIQSVYAQVSGEVVWE